MRRLYVKSLCRLGMAVDVWSRSPYPANVLSNLHANAFTFDGVECGSMEGFLQSLKSSRQDIQRQTCHLAGLEAKQRARDDWKYFQVVFWRGRVYGRQSRAYRELLFRAYRALFQQNQEFRQALLSTRGKRLYHTKGKQDPMETILTEHEFCQLLTAVRDF